MINQFWMFLIQGIQCAIFKTFLPPQDGFQLLFYTFCKVKIYVDVPRYRVGLKLIVPETNTLTAFLPIKAEAEPFSTIKKALFLLCKKNLKQNTNTKQSHTIL